MKKDKNDKWFSTNHLKDDLKSRSVSGGFSTVSGQLISFGMSTLSLIVMARLLSPEDFGLVAMVTAITGFATIFQNLGLSAAVIQKEEIKQSQVSSVFWINVLISLGIAFIIAISAPFLVKFYNEVRLLNITVTLAFGILIASLSLQHNALMKRQMKFKALSLVQIGSTALSLVVGIAMALYGFGYWAIVAQTILVPVLSTIALWFICDWRPGIYIRIGEAKSFLKFGAGITGFDLINYFSRNADSILIGKFLGSGPLGLYSKAYQLLMLPITQLRNPLNAVAFPALSTLQNEKYKYQSFYKRYLFTLAFFSMPLVMYLGIFSEELILIVLGDQWVEAAYIFTLLAISGFIQPVASTRGLVMITGGDTKRYFIFGFANAVFVILGFYIGINWGIEGIAISYAIVNYAFLLPSLFYCFKNTPVSVLDFLSEIFYPLVFSLVSGGTMMVLKYFYDDLPNLILFAIGLFLGGGIYMLCWYSSNASRSKLNQIFEIISLLTKKLKK